VSAVVLDFQRGREVRGKDFKNNKTIHSEKLGVQHLQRQKSPTFLTVTVKPFPQAMQFCTS